MKQEVNFFIERELKFKVTSIEDIQTYIQEHCTNFSCISQTYLVIEGDKEIRIRSILSSGGINYFVTTKAGKGVQRTEIEIGIPYEVYARLSKATKLLPIYKKRYSISLDGLIVEVDEYDIQGHESLRELIVLEVEFSEPEKEEEIRERILSYGFIEKEITHDSTYKNNNIWKVANRLV